MSFIQYIAECEKIVWSMKTHRWFVISDCLPYYKKGISPEEFLKEFYKEVDNKKKSK